MENLNILVFLLLIICLFYISQKTINRIFLFLRLFIRSDSLVFSIVSLIFFPGTVIHEMAHFLMALVLMMKVHEIKVFPEWEKNYIKLGRVLYEKKDFVRGVIVGIAPVIVGLLIFWWLAYFKIFPQSNIGLNILLIYLIFSISSTMFSSKQDLVDLIYIVPVIVIIVGVIYIFNIRVDQLFANQSLMSGINTLIKQINLYLIISIIINLTISLTLISFQKIIKKS